MNPDTAARLRDGFAEGNAALAGLLGRSLTAWES
jgi:hypothetical protein